jgi:katanin p60 ATPase-containing subunit A1
MDIQVPDLSGKLKVALAKAREEGKQLKLQGKAVDAAAKYEAAHKMALQLKDYAKTREEEREYIALSVRCRKHAEDLREGRAKVGPDSQKPPPPPGEPRPAGRKKAKEREEVTELKQTVQGLIQIAKVGWDDIGGLDEVKQEIKFALGIWLAQAPGGPGGKKVQLQSWRNMLFYGPPGTGKTLLAGAASRALKTREDKGAVFFNVKVSSVLSKKTAPLSSRV